MGSHDRPARNPGGMECMSCGVIFIGEEWHDLCRLCDGEFKLESRGDDLPIPASLDPLRKIP